MKAYGNALLLRTAVQSFWNNYFALPDPFDGLLYRRESTQKTDTYTRLGAAPMPTAWVGTKNAKDVNEFSTTITNVPYEATVRIDKELIKYQQWDEVGNMVGNLGEKARANIVSLASTLIVNGTTTTCEDGQFFYDDDHANAGAAYTTAQDNDNTSDITTVAAPTDLEFAAAVRGAIDALYSFKDDQGDPTVPQDDNPANMIVMVPPVYRSVAKRVMLADALTGPVGNDLRGQFTVRVNPYFTQTNQFFLFYAGSSHKPVIVQETGGIRFIPPYEDPAGTGDWLAGVEWYGKVAYGQWRTTVSHIFT